MRWGTCFVFCKFGAGIPSDIFVALGTDLRSDKVRALHFFYHFTLGVFFGQSNGTIFITFYVQTVFATLVLGSSAGLLGAGEGEGSCAAAPFRAEEANLKWKIGCPAWAPCCSEYGYCQPKVMLRVWLNDQPVLYYFLFLLLLFQ